MKVVILINMIRKRLRLWENNKEIVQHTDLSTNNLKHTVWKPPLARQTHQRVSVSRFGNWWRLFGLVFEEKGQQARPHAANHSHEIRMLAGHCAEEEKKKRIDGRDKENGANAVRPRAINHCSCSGERSECMSEWVALNALNTTFHTYILHSNCSN